MRTSVHKYWFLTITTLIACLAFPVGVAYSQTTNWIAYNDHRPGPIIPLHVPTPTAWGTALKVTTYNMGAPGDTTGAVLTNFLDGTALAATMSVIRTGAPDDFGTVVTPRTNSPAGTNFFRKCDLSNAGIVGVDA